MKKNKSHILNTSTVTPFLKVKEKLTKYYTVVFSELRKSVFSDKNKPVIYTLFLLAILGDIFFTAGNSDLRFFGLAGLLVIISLFYKLKSKFTFILCLVLLAIMYFFFLTQGTSLKTEKVAVWIVLFMAVGIAQQWFENETK